MKVSTYTSRLAQAGSSKLIGCLLLTGLALMGCANPVTLTAGTPLAQAEARLGRPNYTCQLNDGRERLIWSRQPFGQFAWGTNVNADGTISGVEALLTDNNFSKLAQGDWTAEQVLCEFGPPAEKGRVGLPSNLQIVWSYRYQQAGVWNSMMHVYLGKDGKKVTRFHPGPDPMYEKDNWPFF
ncbi:hypothetical protein [Mesopusillimonas faecipullorum]|nr:hypothetical protein [Mesopusillimonas faecipullorum]